LTGVWGFAALRAVQALCFAASGPAQQALVADLIGSQRGGRAYGIYALAGGLGQAAGPVLGGWLYDSIGPAVPFYFNGVVLPLCAIPVGR
jgi:MFS family permease